MADNEHHATGLDSVRGGLSRGINRRSFLRTAAGAGYGLGMATYLGVDDFLTGESGEISVVTALERTDPDDPWSLEKRTRRVPADWYRSVQAAFRLHSMLGKVGIPGFFGSAVQPGSHDQANASISVTLSSDDVDRFADTLGDVFSEIPISLDSIPTDIDISAMENDRGDTEPRLLETIPGTEVPGGVGCESGDRLTTLMPALYKQDDRDVFFATSEHGFRSEKVTGRTLSLALQDESEVDLGQVKYAHPVLDIVAVEPSDKYRPASAINGASPEGVIGQLTRIGLADLAARGESLEKVGTMTGHTTGPIKGIDAKTCFTGHCRRGQLQWGDEDEMTDGDSGSVSYYSDPETGRKLIAGLNNARTWWPGQSYMWGTAAYHLLNERGYHF